MAAGFRLPAGGFEPCSLRGRDKGRQIVLEVGAARNPDFNRVFATFGEMPGDVLRDILIRNGHEAACWGKANAIHSYRECRVLRAI